MEDKTTHFLLSIACDETTWNQNGVTHSLFNITRWGVWDCSRTTGCHSLPVRSIVNKTTVAGRFQYHLLLMWCDVIAENSGWDLQAIGHGIACDDISWQRICSVTHWLLHGMRCNDVPWLDKISVTHSLFRHESCNETAWQKTTCTLTNC